HRGSGVRNPCAQSFSHPSEDEHPALRHARGDGVLIQLRDHITLPPVGPPTTIRAVLKQLMHEITFDDLACSVVVPNPAHCHATDPSACTGMCQHPFSSGSSDAPKRSPQPRPTPATPA